MGRLDAKGFALGVGVRRVPGRHRRHCGLLVAALLAIALLCCLFGSVALASAVPPDSPSQSLLAMPAVQQAQLVAADGVAYDYFGHSVAISGDTALVGAYTHSTAAGNDAGVAYVFVRSGGDWTLQQTLRADDGAAWDWFGWSVSLDGDTALVGAPWCGTAGGAWAGAAYVFVRSGDTWTLQQKVIANDGAAYDRFSYSVALDGDTALVGALYHDTVKGANAGAAYVFVRSGTTWSQQQKLTAADGAAEDYFGTSAALAGQTALVGASNHDTGGKADAGAAYVFVRSGTTWSKQAELTAADGAAEDYFGNSVALAGQTALVGAPDHDVAGNVGAGAAYVFVRSGTTWTKQAEPTAADGAAEDYFGLSVALSGQTALVGAWNHYVAGKGSAGASYVFTRSSTTWSKQAELTAADGAADDCFGGAVALSHETALVGAERHQTAKGADAGAAYVFLLTPQPKPTITKLKPTSGKRGATVTITGTGFRTKRGTGFVKFGARKCATYVSWSATRVRCKVPAKAKLGTLKVKVTTGAGTSNAKSFKVKP